MKLSVIIPAFNERVSLPLILAKVAASLPGIEKEIVVVDDCSTDGTSLWLSDTFGEHPRHASPGPSGGLVIGDEQPPGPSAAIKALFHATNQGKGAALRTGLRACTGDIIVIQDADLEYDPADWEQFWPLFAENRADVAYGSRFITSKPHRCLYYHHYLANKLISFLFSLLYNQTLGDIEVCTKMFRREVLPLLTLRCNDFGFEIEFSSNVARNRHLRLYEIGISYYGRTYEEGKKINWTDGVKALWYLLRFRVT